KRRSDGPVMAIARASSVPPGGSVLFRYPTDEDPCILLRAADGAFHAYSQVCTHLSCAVVHRPASASLLCPCHHGWFDEATGTPKGGPPARPLPRIRIRLAGDDVIATGREV